MEWARGPFHREQGVKSEGSREWMIATTISVSNWWHNRELRKYSPRLSVFNLNPKQKHGRTKTTPMAKKIQYRRTDSMISTYGYKSSTYGYKSMTINSRI